MPLPASGRGWVEVNEITEKANTTLNREHNGYIISEDRALLDMERVHCWLSNTYWSPGIARERVERATQHSSLVLGVYLEGEQVAYCRVVSDRASFAYIGDVYVDEAHRGKGLGKAMIRYALEHPEHQDLRRWVLATLDAHDVYAAVGFEPLVMPERWMSYLPKSGS